jgi:hypothetical protein
MQMVGPLNTWLAISRRAGTPSPSRVPIGELIRTDGQVCRAATCVYRATLDGPRRLAAPGPRRPRAGQHHHHPRNGTGKHSSGRTGPASSKPQPMSELPQPPPQTNPELRNLHPNRTFLSSPVEDCEGCPALAGIRNVGLDTPSARRPDSLCNFGGVGPRRRSRMHHRDHLRQPMAKATPRSRP